MVAKPQAVKVETLTEKQRRFVESYLGAACGNACEAARQAGYNGNDRSLAVIGSENLRKPDIRKAIDARTQKGGLVATREERQAFLTKIMRSETRRMNERLKATELLCKTQGDFIERRDVNMKVDKTEQREEIENFLELLKTRKTENTTEEPQDDSTQTLQVVKDSSAS